jgi:hypothetical protein
MARGGRRGERRRSAARTCATHGSLALLRRTSVSAISGMKMRVGRSGIAQGSQQSRMEATLAARPDAKGPRFQHTRGRQAQQNVNKAYVCRSATNVSAKPSVLCKLVAGKTSLSSKSWTKTDGQNLLQKFVQESSGTFRRRSASPQHCICCARA